MEAAGASAVRPLRADARRNRERIMAAARVCFAADGIEAQMDDVARQARVGVGTVYRHFPDKAALLAALKAERFGALAALATDALDQEDPWESFRGFLWRAAELASEDRAHCQVMAAAPSEAGPELDELRARTADLVERGKLAGAIREDFEPDDVPVIMCALGRVMEATRETEPLGWQRHLALMLDGMRASAAASPLPE
ncbi:MAG: helix-turn-helix domain-containing protein [Thermoleophilaceae bacterium]